MKDRSHSQETLKGKTAPPVALTIAGSDSGGGAGIQADLKSFAALGVYGTCAVTALTAQNTVGVQQIHIPPEDFLKEQIKSILDDFDVKAIKIGMVPDEPCATVIAKALPSLKTVPIVFDPVLVATSGDRLSEDNIASVFKDLLFMSTSLVTPNLIEAASLLDEKVASNLKEMKYQASKLVGEGANAVYLKGGHGAGNDIHDVFHDGQLAHILTFPRIQTMHTHGTGCTLSSLITGFLAKNYPLDRSVHKARLLMQELLQQSQHMFVGAGHGPLDHFGSGFKPSS